VAVSSDGLTGSFYYYKSNFLNPFYIKPKTLEFQSVLALALHSGWKPEYNGSKVNKVNESPGLFAASPSWAGPADSLASNHRNSSGSSQVGNH
jgi:hypothetical protein